jgi:hypothetical protein
LMWSVTLAKPSSSTARNGDHPVQSRPPIRGFVKSDGDRKIVRLSPQLLPQESTETVDAAARRVWRRVPTRAYRIEASRTCKNHR